MRVPSAWEHGKGSRLSRIFSNKIRQEPDDPLRCVLGEEVPRLRQVGELLARDVRGELPLSVFLVNLEYGVFFN